MMCLKLLFIDTDTYTHNIAFLLLLFLSFSLSYIYWHHRSSIPLGVHILLKKKNVKSWDFKSDRTSLRCCDFNKLGNFVLNRFKNLGWKEGPSQNSFTTFRKVMSREFIFENFIYQVSPKLHFATFNVKRLEPFFPEFSSSYLNKFKYLFWMVFNSSDSL